MSTNKKHVKYGSEALERDFGPLTFAKVLSSHRLCEEMTQAQMAEILGITKQSLCDLEKGRRIPSPSRAASIAKKLHMLPETFIRLALQDQLRQEKMYYNVILEKSSSKVAA